MQSIVKIYVIDMVMHVYLIILMTVSSPFQARASATDIKVLIWILGVLNHGS